ncbi:MAG: GumC family protein [Thermoanaerobaculia bacterium]
MLRDPLPRVPPDEDPPDAPGFAGDPGPELHLVDYLEKLRRHWKLAVLCVLVSVLGATVFYLITPKEYQAKARIQIERQAASPLNSGQNAWVESLWNMEFYPTQYRLLESRGLAERVVVNLGLADDQFFNPGGRSLVAPAPGGQASEDPEQVDERVLGQMAQRLRTGLEVNPVRDTQLVDVVYKSSSPQFAARVANGFADAFIDWGVSSRQHTVGWASSFLESQIESLKQEIQEKEAKLRDFSRSSDIVLDRDSNVVLEQLQSFNQDFIAAKARRVEAEARYKELLETPRQEVADRYSDGTVSELMREHRSLEREYRTKLQTYKPDWPEMVELRARIEDSEKNLQKVIGEQVENAKETAYAEYQTALRRERALQEELDLQKNQLLDQSSDAVELTNLQVEIATSRDLMDQLLRQQSETEVAARLQTSRESNIRVVDRALVPSSAFRPSLRQNLGMGLGLGLLLGLGAVFLVEYMDRTLKTPEDVERHLRLPNLAVVPDVSSGGGRYGRKAAYGYGRGYGAMRKRRRPGIVRRVAGSGDEATIEGIEKVPHEHPRLSVSEAYRALRTALLLSSARQLQVVTVTSAGSGEGKTASSTNLAVVMAQLGRRVLLVDGDLRKPRLHEVFQVSNRKGLVNVLAGGEDPSSALVQTDVPHLHLIPAGPMPPNPSELLSSERMEELLHRARSRFDFVIVDTPPVLAVTDATVIGAQSDGVVLCLRAGKVLRTDARTCRDRLLMADVKILGAVLNRHTEGSGGRPYHYYYAAYGDDASESGSAA